MLSLEVEAKLPTTLVVFESVTVPAAQKSQPELFRRLSVRRRMDSCPVEPPLMERRRPFPNWARQIPPNSHLTKTLCIAKLW